MSFLKKTDYNQPNIINDGMKSSLVLILGQIARHVKVGEGTLYELVDNKVLNIIMVYVEKGGSRLKSAG